METTWGPRWAAGPTPSGSTRACPDTDQRLRQQLAEVFQSSLDGKGGGSSPARPRERWEREAGAARCWLPPRSSRLPVLRAEQGWESSGLCSQDSAGPPQGGPRGAPARSIRPAQSASVVRREPRGHSSVPVCSALVTPGLSLTLSCPCDISGF